MATHSSVLAWRIPGTGEPGGLLSLGWHRVRHDWNDLAAAACQLSWWWYLTISSSLVPFSSYLQSFPASGSFPISLLFTSGDQSCSFSISPSDEYSGLIFFGNDCFDLPAVQGTLKSLLQHHSMKALILQPSAFFMVSHIFTWLPESYVRTILLSVQ